LTYTMQRHRADLVSSMQSPGHWLVNSSSAPQELNQ
jgi:hypothetical protein